MSSGCIILTAHKYMITNLAGSVVQFQVTRVFIGVSLLRACLIKSLTTGLNSISSYSSPLWRSGWVYNPNVLKSWLVFLVTSSIQEPTKTRLIRNSKKCRSWCQNWAQRPNIKPEDALSAPLLFRKLQRLQEFRPGAGMKSSAPSAPLIAGTDLPVLATYGPPSRGIQPYRHACPNICLTRRTGTSHKPTCPHPMASGGHKEYARVSAR